MQKVKNHGSFLQAYALCNVIKNETGAEVEFVDFSSKHGVLDFCKESYLSLKSTGVKFLISKLCVTASKTPLLGKLLKRNKKIKALSNLFNYYKVYAINYEKKILENIAAYQ